MLKSIIILLCCMFAFNILGLAGQNRRAGLEIGDELPNVELNKILNFESQKVTVAELRGKVVIIDFWNRYCSACISAFPKMEQLQKEFGNKIQILLVTNNSREELAYLFKNSPNVINCKLPMVLEDSILHQLFPHSGEPYLVWINEEGKVVATTFSEQATAKNIQSLLDGQTTEIAIRRDQEGFNVKMPLLVEGGGRQWKHLQYYSMIMNWVEGNPATMGGMIIDPITHESRGGKSFYNFSIIALYQIAYENYDIPVVVESNRKESYFQPFNDPAKMQEWRKNNLYNYELLLPEQRHEEWKMFMRQDLERFFGLKGVVEERIKTCLELSLIGKEDRIKTKGGEPIAEKTSNEYVFRNVPLDIVKLNLLKSYINTEEYPVFVDSTGYTGNVDMKLKFDVSNLKLLNEELKLYGMQIRTIEIPVKCLILKGTN